MQVVCCDRIIAFGARASRAKTKTRLMSSSLSINSRICHLLLVHSVSNYCLGPSVDLLRHTSLPSGG